LLLDYSKGLKDGEGFGDFCVRQGVVKATGQGSDFHD
jgi:hypothetical protein